MSWEVSCSAVSEIALLRRDTYVYVTYLEPAIFSVTITGQKGPVADALNLNAGVALAAAEVAGSVEEGVAMAKESQESGKAGVVLDNWIKLSQELKVLSRKSL